jgi:hypothetical protein
MHGKSEMVERGGGVATLSLAVDRDCKRRPAQVGLVRSQAF